MLLDQGTEQDLAIAPTLAARNQNLQEKLDFKN